MDGAERINIGELTIDAAFLAGRFALSPDALRRHMKQDLVRGVVERGEGADTGRTRLTVRIGNRIWIAVIASEPAVGLPGRLSCIRPHVLAEWTRRKLRRSQRR